MTTPLAGWRPGLPVALSSLTMLTNARRPLLAALLTFALVLPLHAARAQKPAGGGVASQRTAQVQQVRVPGQKRYGMSGGASTAGATSVKSGSRLGNWLRRNFTVRGEVRQLEQTAKGMVRQGNLTAAAEELATNPVAPQGWR